MMKPEMTEKLIVCNLPHLHGLQRELANNPEQAKASAYARNFQKPGAHKMLNAKALAFWVKDKDAREKYVAAFERSSMEGMLNFYKANYPREPYEPPTEDPHDHHDVRFLVLAPPHAKVAGNHESEELRWVDLAELDRLMPKGSSLRMAHSALDRLRTRPPNNGVRP